MEFAVERGAVIEFRIEYVEPGGDVCAGTVFAEVVEDVTVIAYAGAERHHDLAPD